MGIDHKNITTFTGKYLLCCMLFLLLHSSVNGQDATEDQSIELPEFVITGEQSISIPVMKKDKPELVPTLSEDFFRPVFTPEKLALSKSSDPIERELNLYKNANAFDGLLILGAGFRTLPKGEFYFNQNSDNFLFNSKLYGMKITEYVKNAGYNISGLAASLNFYVNNTSSFLPGLNIKLAGDFFRDSYKFFGSEFPDSSRETFNTFGILSFHSDVSRYVKYAVRAKTEMLDLKDLSFKENVFTGELDLDIMFNSFGIGTNGQYKIQEIDQNSVTTDNNYYGGNVFVVVEPSQNLKLRLGWHHSGIENKELSAPYGTVTFKLSNRLTFVGKYHPNTEFYTYNYFIHRNKYIGVNSIENIFQENNSHTSVLFKYQYMKYYEINIGGSFANVNNLPYFDDTETAGIFLLNTTGEIEKIQAYINMLFHSGPYGFFYGEVNYNQVKFDNGTRVPYYPSFTSSLIYGFDFGETTTVKTKLDLMFENFAGVENSIELPNYLDLSIFVDYKISGNLKLTLAVENILNNENYIYNGYLEKTIDFIGGIKYRW